MNRRHQAVVAISLMVAGFVAVGVGLALAVGPGVALTVVGVGLAGLALQFGWRR